MAVVTPAFVSDCLETLEEIAMEASHEFKEHGGESFMAIPCMNDGDEWCQTITNWINEWAKYNFFPRIHKFKTKLLK